MRASFMVVAAPWERSSRVLKLQPLQRVRFALRGDCQDQGAGPGRDGALLTNGNDGRCSKSFFIGLYMRSIVMLKNFLLVAMSTALVNTAYALDAAQQAEMVTAHNKWRQTVGTPPLAWSAGLATTAQAWADTLKAAQGCKPAHSGTAGVGENIFWAGATTQTSTSSTGVKTTTSTPQAVTATQATDYWASEGKDYTYSTNSCATGKVCSHYTQVVWKTTTDVGCGNAVCADNTQVWVCQYAPPGNHVGQQPY